MTEKYIQHPHKREGTEVHVTTHLNDTKNYETETFVVTEIDASTWRIYPGSFLGNKSEPSYSKEIYVDVPAYLGKIIRNAIIAQNRSHRGIYAHHETPREDLPELSENDYDEDMRPLVSSVMRDINCHKLILHVLNMAKSAYPLGKIAKSEYTSLLKKYHQSEEFISEIFEPPKSGKKVNLERVYSGLESIIRSMKQQHPLIGRIGDPHRDTELGQGEIHSFVVLGETQRGEILCFEKVGWGSLPFRITTLQQILEDHSDKHQWRSMEWQFAPVEDLII